MKAAVAAALFLLGTSVCAVSQIAGADLAEANAALQAGEADKAMALLNPVLDQFPNDAEAHNLACRVWLSQGQFDNGIAECQRAVNLNEDRSEFHLWLGRALGDKADQASFLSAYSLAKRLRAEFESAIRLDAKNAEALASLGEFDCSAPGVVGGGLDKAEAIADKLEKVEAARAHELRAQIAEQRKDYETAEREYKQAIAAGTHPAYQWMALASFLRRRQRGDEMVTAVRSGVNAARRDAHAAVALYNGASTLQRANRELQLAAKMLEDYLASPNKTEEAPAFIAWSRLAQIKQQLGDPEAANRSLAAAMALAHDYKPGHGVRH
jgi:tetratricopeptide (TPR) repeat protein